VWLLLLLLLWQLLHEIHTHSRRALLGVLRKGLRKSRVAEAILKCPFYDMLALFARQPALIRWTVGSNTSRPVLLLLLEWQRTARTVLRVATGAVDARPANVLHHTGHDQLCLT
jgi:hypothetical protein